MPAPWRVRFAFAKRHAQLLRQNITTGSRMKHFIYNCFLRTGSPRPSPQEQRFAAYVEGLAKAAGHRDRQQALKDYCRGLPLGQRTSI
jgi:hypothetical protein